MPSTRASAGHGFRRRHLQRDREPPDRTSPPRTSRRSRKSPRARAYGPATTILSGLAEVPRVEHLVCPDHRGRDHGIGPGLQLVGPEYIIYGVALIGIGWLTHAATWCPWIPSASISTTRTASAKWVQMPPGARRSDRLDAVGNTYQGYQGRGDRLCRHRSRGAVRLVHHRHQPGPERPAGSRQDLRKCAGEVHQHRGPARLRRIPDRRRRPDPVRRLSIKAVSRGERHGGRGLQGIRRAGREGKVMPDYLAVGISTRPSSASCCPASRPKPIPIIVGFLLAEALGGFPGRRHPVRPVAGGVHVQRGGVG